MRNLFAWTAWPMAVPVPYSRFHLSLCAAGVLLAVLAALRLSKADHISPSRVLGGCGLLLTVMEIYKQGFLFFVENGGSYDWWYFPFQLCSIPMYLCLLYPLALKSAPPSGGAAGGSASLRSWIPVTLATFIQDFGLLGGILALAVPDGLMHPYWTMTLHGFLWHFLLIFSGLYSAMRGITDESRRGYLRTLPLFFICCITALTINTAAGPQRDADMFYISPYHASSQPVFHKISTIIGILPGIAVYIGTVILGGLIVHTAVRRLIKNR